MAHGDYKCCAICDNKQEYVGMNKEFKDDICESCRESNGIATVKQLLEKINFFTDKEELEKWIKEIHLCECYYQNDVDDLIAFKLTGKISEKWKSSADWLGALQ